MQKINPSRILYEDEHILAVDKLPRELVVAGKGRMDRKPLLDFLRETYGSSLKPLHRLDFETSGVVLFAKTKRCFDEAVTNGKFVGEDADVRKIYRAIVMGNLPRKKGVIDVPLKARASKEKVAAVTEYRVIEEFGDTSYVEAVIRAGKFHQVRQHFAAIGHPLVNDDEHGNARFNRMFEKAFGFKYMFLHAQSVECAHFITGEKMMIHAPLPESFERVLKELGS